MIFVTGLPEYPLNANLSGNNSPGRGKAFVLYWSHITQKHPSLEASLQYFEIRS